MEGCIEILQKSIGDRLPTLIQTLLQRDPLILRLNCELLRLLLRKPFLRFQQFFAKRLRVGDIAKF